MSELWARSALGAYRWLGAGVYPLIGPYLAVRAAKGKEDRKRRRERYGYASQPRPQGPLVWFHAASVGEMSAITPLAEHIVDLGINVVLTTGTVTSANLADERLGGRIVHQYVPLDLKPAVSRFLTHWKPDLAIIAESEIWPITILELGVRRVPQVLVNGRLSDRTFSAWSKRSYLAEALFENMSLVVAQSDLDGERFSALGARPVTVTGNLKVDAEPLAVDAGALSLAMDQIGARKTWAAISTHPGEEALVAEAHVRLKVKHPDLLTILVPRHPARAEEVMRTMSAEGLTVARHSKGDEVTDATDILLGDTIGDMGLYLRLTEIAFVGKSLSGEGGQNPLEPALLNTAILSGKNVQNFRESYQRLIKNGGARLVRDCEMLARGVDYLLVNDKVRRHMMKAAAATVRDMRGTLDRTLKALDPFVQPLVVESRLARSGLGNGK